jgi:hypothetical protein
MPSPGPTTAPRSRPARGPPLAGPDRPGRDRRGPRRPPAGPGGGPAARRHRPAHHQRPARRGAGLGRPGRPAGRGPLAARDRRARPGRLAGVRPPGLRGRLRAGVPRVQAQARHRGPRRGHRAHVPAQGPAGRAQRLPLLAEAAGGAGVRGGGGERHRPADLHGRTPAADRPGVRPRPAVPLGRVREPAPAPGYQRDPGGGPGRRRPHGGRVRARIHRSATRSATSSGDPGRYAVQSSTAASSTRASRPGIGAGPASTRSTASAAALATWNRVPSPKGAKPWATMSPTMARNGSQ